MKAPKRKVTARTKAQGKAASPDRGDVVVTPFRRRVYDAIVAVPAGRVTTYQAVAVRLGSSPRAVGQALRHNPFAPAVPCHRVVASNGFLGGFQGQWGLRAPALASKVALLKAEGVKVSEDGFVSADAILRSL